MSDKRTEIEEEEDLQEFKASGEDSSVPDPNPNKKTPKRRGDKDKGEDNPAEPGKSVTKEPQYKSRPSMIKDAVKLMGEMSEEELQDVLSVLNGEEVNEDNDDEEKVELEKITTEDIDISDDVEAMFGDDEDLSEEFKTKAINIFEHAVVAKVNEILESTYVDVNADKEALTESVTEDLSEKLNDYLDYVVSEWVEDNRIAIEKGIYADLVESFMTGLKGLFEEHYIDVPEEKIDVVEELAERNSELEESISELTENNVELYKKMKDYEINGILDEVSEDLTDSQADKLRSLAEGIEFRNSEDFTNKVSMLKENYFGNDDVEDSTTLNEDVDNPLPIDEEEKDNTPPHMRNYVSAIKRHAVGTK